MKVDDRSNSVDASRREDRNRQKTQRKDPAQRLMTQQGSQGQQSHEARATFDEVLQNYTRSHSSLPPSAENLKFDSKIQELLPVERKKDPDSSDRKTESKKDKNNSSDEKEKVSSRETVMKNKIFSKQDMGSQEGGANSQGSGKENASSRLNTGQTQKQSLKKVEVSAFQVAGGQHLQRAETTTLASQPQKGSPEIPKAVLDQIVQYVRVGLNKNLDKEIQVDLSEKIFRGLSLRVSSHEGKVDVLFLTPDANIRRIFEGEKEKMETALKEKGIQVRSIQVRFKGEGL